MNPTTPAKPPLPAFRPGRTAGWFVVGWGLLLLASQGVLRLLHRGDLEPMNHAAALVCGAAGLTSLVPVWVLSFRSLSAAALGFLAGTLVRLALCGAAVLAAGHWLDRVASDRFGLWVAGWYVATLMLDVWLVGAFVVRPPGPPGSLETPQSTPSPASGATSGVPGGGC